MRKSLLTALLGFALLATPAAFSTKSDAANPLRPNVPAARQGDGPTPLPNYDIRLAGRGEFTETELNSTLGRQKAAASVDTAVQSRASAVETFRAGLSAKRARNLRAEVNEAGALKNFFVDGGALSGPQADLPDNIARNFLKGSASLFALTAKGVNSLKLNKEDKDAGTSFLEYSQTVGGIKVFEGEVRVAVGRSGEVLSVREGFLLGAQKVNTEPTLSEAEGIARAFEHVGRGVNPSFSELRGRHTKGGNALFANPLSSNLEDVHLGAERRPRGRRGAPGVARLRRGRPRRVVRDSG